MKILRRILFALASLFVLAQTSQAHYDPNIGRWINRDPIGERVGYNLYAISANDSVDEIDILGLSGPTKEAGSKELSELKAKIDTIVADPECNCPNKEHVKKAGKELQERLVRLWEKNRGLDDETQKVGGHWCWDWAKGFHDAINSVASGIKGICPPEYRQFTKPSPQITLSAPKDGLTGGRSLDATQPIPNTHWAVKVCFGECTKEKCCITIDDGFFEDGLVHGQGWPKTQLEKGWKELNGNERLLDKQGNPYVDPGRGIPLVP